MLEQANQPLQGQMVSGHYVAPHWSQMLGQHLQRYTGNKAMDDVMTESANMQRDQSAAVDAMFGIGGKNGVWTPDSSSSQTQQGSSGIPPQAYAAALSEQQGGMPLLPGMDNHQSRLAYDMMGQKEYMKAIANNSAPTQIERQLMAAGLQPGTPEFQAAILQNVNPDQRPTSLMQNAQAAGLQPGSPEYRQFIADNARSGTTVNVGAGEKAWDTESAKLFAKRYDDISSAAMNAQQMMGMYDLAEQALNSGVRTGLAADAEITLRQLGAAMGMDTDPEKLAGGELIRAVQNRMALIMRSPDGGMGMPGALSDRDIRFLKDSQIGIDRSPEGNMAMLQAFRAMEQRKIQISQLADDYIQQNGRLDAGFNRTVREFANSNPLFDVSKPLTSGGDRSSQLDSILGF